MARVTCLMFCPLLRELEHMCFMTHNIVMYKNIGFL